MSFINYVMVIIMAGLLCSCDRQKNKEYIDQAVKLMIRDPANAMISLDSVDARKLSNYQFARFTVLSIRAREMTGKGIWADTAVFGARDYIINRKIAPDAALACFVAAGVYEQQGEAIKAIKQYRDAAGWAEKTDEYLLTSFIHYNTARLLYSLRMYRESLFSLKKSSGYRDKTGSGHEYRIYSLELAGLNYLHLEQPDSALMCYHEAMDLVPASDPSIRRNLLQCQAVAYRKSGDHLSARKKCMEAIALTNKNDSLENGKLDLILAGIYADTGQYDSASLYIQRAKDLLEDHDELIDLIGLYQLLSLIEEKKGHDNQASQYRQLLAAYERSLEYADKAVLEEKKRYRDNTTMMIQEGRNNFLNRTFITMIISGSVVMVILSWLTSFRRNSRMKKRTKEEISGYRKMVEIHRERLEREKNIEIAQIKRMVDDEQMKILFQIDDIAKLKKLVNDYNADKEIRRHVKSMIEKISWKNLYPIINHLYEGLPELFISDLVLLNNIELQTCCMSYAGFTSLTISAILDESYYTTRNRQSQVRKKLGMEPGGSFWEFLNRKYGITELENKYIKAHLS